MSASSTAPKVKSISAKAVLWLIALAYGLALFTRVWRWLYSYISGDGAICGMLGNAVNQGRWPVFFFGQNFMGSLDGYFSAPLFALFGPSTLTLGVCAPFFSLATMVVLHLAMRLCMRPVGVAAGLLFWALPPALVLFHAGKPNNHYAVGLFLCAVVLWLSLLLWRERGRPWLVAFFWGLFCGAAFWTNFQSVVVIFPCAIFLLATKPRLYIRPPVLAAALGIVLGAGPLLWYNLNHGWVHAGQAGLLELAKLPQYAMDMALNALPLLLGFNPPSAGGATAPGDFSFYTYLVVGLAFLLGAARLVAMAWQPERRGAALPVLILLANLGLLLVSRYGKELADWDLRYLIPVFLSLPFVWGAVMERLFREGRAALIVGLTMLLAVNLAGWPGFWHGFLLLFDKPYSKVAEPNDRGIVERLRASGFKHIYSAASPQVSFLAEDKPLMAEPWRELRSYVSTRVDASLNPAWNYPIAPYLNQLGLGYKTDKQGLVHSVREPAGVERLLPAAGWRAADLAGADLGLVLWDRDYTSGQTFPGEPKQGHGFVIDLGRETRVAGLALVTPDYGQIPGGIALYAAGADGRFGLIRRAGGLSAPFYFSGPHPFFKVRYPRVEAYFPARAIRYLKVEHLGGGKKRDPVSFREVLLFGPGHEGNLPGWEEAGERLLKAVRAAKPARVYADAWPSAVVRLNLGDKVWSVPANYSLDNYGSLNPPPDQPLPLNVNQGSLLVVENRQAEDVAASLNRFRVKFGRGRAGRYTLFALKGRAKARVLPLKAVKSNKMPAEAAGLADPKRAVRWASDSPQGPGAYLQADLGAVVAVGGVRVSCPRHPNDWPRGLKAQVSDDGADWRPAELAAAGPLVFSGQVVLARPGAGLAEFVFSKPVKARYLRLSVSRGHSLWWWSVQKLTVLAP